MLLFEWEISRYIPTLQVLHVNNKVMIQIWQFCQKPKQLAILQSMRRYLLTEMQGIKKLKRSQTVQK